MIELLGTEFGVDNGFRIGSDDNVEMMVGCFTASLPARNGTASKAAIAIGALRDGMRIETSADSIRIMALEIGPRASLHCLTA